MNISKTMSILVLILTLSYSYMAIAHDPLDSVIGLNDMGSAVVLEKNNKQLVVLTALHVIKKDLPPTIEIIYRDSIIKVSVKVLRIDAINDLALLSIQLPEELPLVPISFCVDNPKVYNKVLAIGSGLGLPPFPTEGMISIPELLLPNLVTMHSAPITFGNSGGGLFKKEQDNYCLIGINQRMAATNQLFPMTHMGIAVHIKVIKEFYGKRN